jgi:hypothetical protein
MTSDGNSWSIVPYDAYTAYTPALPQFYWDVYSAEQRVKQICMEIDKLVNYVNAIALSFNKLNSTVTVLENTVNNELPYMDDRITILEKALETLVTSMLIYDPTKGVYTNSMNQSRRMLQLLSNPSSEHLTVQTIVDSEITVSEFGESMCGVYVNDAFKRMSGITMPYQEVN